MAEHINIIAETATATTALSVLPIEATTVSQSSGLSDRHLALHKDGRTLVDDSNVSEGNLKTIIVPLIERARRPC